ncbi:acetyltransferase [Tahibacter soli]|uniref:Acetyltransferase n=1 Tax=Tahibacter soli TaxID=2983605 RepID=A0A9X3YIY6_9GAMM|nr:acetyltransferase [Tahibacter soli]MDC8013206.1 acetyltransferase [Tahibacter soli]
MTAGFHTDEAIASVAIAGAGGFGLEIFDYLTARAAHGGPRVAGFLDDTPGAPLPRGVDAAHLGTIDGYRPTAGQVVVVAIGSVRGRLAVLARLRANGARTPAFVADMTRVSGAATLADGVVVCPFSIVNRNATIGDGALVNVHCSVGHGARVGAHSILSPYAALNGDAAIGERCFLGTRATIFPGVRIGDGCIVDSHTPVRADAPDSRMISSRGQYLVNALRGA